MQAKRKINVSDTLIASAAKQHHLAERFETIKVHNELLKHICFKIRYLVYCEEFGFEPLSAFKERLETDNFDRYSEHFLVRERRSGEYIGTFRVVKRLDDEHPLPIEQNYSGRYAEEIFEPCHYHGGNVIEVSRLAIINPRHTNLNYRRYEVARLLYLGAACYFSRFTKAKLLFCLMDERLALKLARIGLPFIKCGETIEFKGRRSPYVLLNSANYSKLSVSDQCIFQHLNQELSR